MNLRKVRDVLKELRPAVQQSGARQFFDVGNEREAAELQRAGYCHMLMLYINRHLGHFEAMQ